MKKKSLLFAVCFLAMGILFLSCGDGGNSPGDNDDKENGFNLVNTQWEGVVEGKKVTLAFLE